MFFGYDTLNDCYQNGGGTGCGRNALSGTDEFAVEFRNNEADSFCGAGAVRNDVYCASAASSEVAFTLRTVKRHLVASVSVNGGHDT